MGKRSLIMGAALFAACAFVAISAAGVGAESKGRGTAGPHIPRSSTCPVGCCMRLATTKTSSSAPTGVTYTVTISFRNRGRTRAGRRRSRSTRVWGADRHRFGYPDDHALGESPSVRASCF